MTQEHRTQQSPTSAPEPGELPAAALVQVVGGTEDPNGAGDHNGVVDSGKATPILM